MSHKASLASCFLACAFEMATKGGDERWRQAILKAFVGHLSNGFPVRSPDPPLRLRFPLPPSRKRWDEKSVTGHGPTCGMRMLNFLFLQASQRRLKAARRPKSGVYRHPPSEFLLPPPAMSMQCSMPCSAPNGATNSCDMQRYICRLDPPYVNAPYSKSSFRDHMVAQSA